MPPTVPSTAPPSEPQPATAEPPARDASTPSGAGAALSVRDLHLRYANGPWVIEDLDLDVAPGEILCVLGPSGCGKSTLLRLVCGFEAPAWGEIRRGEQILSQPGYVLPPEQRGIGMLFQDFAVFPHLTVLENVRFGLEPGFWTGLGRRLLGQRAPRESAEQRAHLEELLRLSGLQGLGERYAHELSGGQLQRVALARALAPRPWLLLLDEPFSELDAGLRTRIRADVREVLKTMGITAILVTHDQEEAANMADRIAVFNRGRFEQLGTPEDVIERPATRFVASFFGTHQFLPGRVEAGVVHTELGRLPLPPGDAWPDGPADVLLRPNQLARVAERDGVPARVTALQFQGVQPLYTVQVASGRSLQALLPGERPLQVGETVHMAVRSAHLALFPPEPAEG